MKIQSVSTLPTSRDEQAQINPYGNPEVVKCPGCDCEFFEIITVQRIERDHTVVLGQQLPSAEHSGFKIMKCVRCSTLLEPVITGHRQDSLGKLYRRFIDQLEG